MVHHIFHVLFMSENRVNTYGVQVHVAYHNPPHSGCTCWALVAEAAYGDDIPVHQTLQLLSTTTAYHAASCCGPFFARVCQHLGWPNANWGEISELG